MSAPSDCRYLFGARSSGVVILLAVWLALTLSSCGDDVSTVSDEAGSTREDSEASEATAPSPAKEPAAVA